MSFTVFMSANIRGVNIKLKSDKIHSRKKEFALSCHRLFLSLRFLVKSDLESCNYFNWPTIQISRLVQSTELVPIHGSSYQDKPS